MPYGLVIDLALLALYALTGWVVVKVLLIVALIITVLSAITLIADASR